MEAAAVQASSIAGRRVGTVAHQVASEGELMAPGFDCRSKLDHVRRAVAGRMGDAGRMSLVEHRQLVDDSADTVVAAVGTGHMTTRSVPDRVGCLDCTPLREL